MAAQSNLAEGNIARFFRELRIGTRNQGNVIFALIFKEIKSRAGPDGYGLFSLAAIALEPAILVIGMALFFFFLRRQEISGVHVALYLVVSYLPFGIIRRAMATIPKAVKANAAFYAYQQVKPIDAVFAQFILESALMMLGSFVLLFGLWWVLDLRINFDHVPETLGVIAMMLVSGLGIGLFLATYGTRYSIVLKAASLFSRVLFFASAVIHPLSELHDRAGNFLLWNPLAHLEELLRYYTLGMKPFAGVTASFPAGFMFIALFLGLTSYYVNRLELLKR